MKICILLNYNYEKQETTHECSAYIDTNCNYTWKIKQTNKILYNSILSLGQNLKTKPQKKELLTDKKYIYKYICISYEINKNKNRQHLKRNTLTQKHWQTPTHPSIHTYTLYTMSYIHSSKCINKKRKTEVKL